MLPFMLEIKRRQMAKPSPNPAPIGFVEKKGSKVLPASSAGMPAPVSDTLTTT
jgi:hypothetical protein